MRPGGLLAVLGTWAALSSCNSLFGINEPRDAPIPHISLTNVSAGPLHGGDGGAAPMPMLCASDEAVIGIQVKATDTVWGLGIECGRMELGADASGYSVSVALTTKSYLAGGGVYFDPPLTTSELVCKSSSVVTDIWTTTWDGLVGTPTLKTISFSCSKVIVNSAHQLELASEITDTFNVGAADVGVMPFRDDCGMTGRAVAGFSIRNGTAVDAVAVNCGTPTLDGPLP